jgi:hypothetical protein
MIELPVLPFRRGPCFPSVGFVEDEGVFLALQLGIHRFVLRQPVQVFQEQEPRGLLRVVQLGSAASFLSKNVVDIFEGLFKH